MIQPEDDVPHVRDPLRRLGHRAGLLPAQITVAASLIAAASETMRVDDFLLCSAIQASEFGLTWRPLAGDLVARGYSISALTSADAEHVRASLESHVGPILGVPGAVDEQVRGARA